MSTISLSALDQQELLHLAAIAGKAGDRAGALACLKEAVARPEAGTTAHYLLGVEYAELRLYERAIDQIEAALALDPALAIARFQLGLLCLSSGNGSRAVEVLQVLYELDESNPLRHFAAGLCELAGDAMEPALASLRRGIALNVDNAPLNLDMQRIIEGVQALQTGAADIAPEQDARLMFLAAYTGNTSH
jgi:tetratricopeptide (TPR) repeat protein